VYWYGVKLMIVFGLMLQVLGVNADEEDVICCPTPQSSRDSDYKLGGA
jgi:hypothetical protein